MFLQVCVSPHGMHGEKRGVGGKRWDMCGGGGMHGEGGIVAGGVYGMGERVAGGCMVGSVRVGEMAT